MKKTVYIFAALVIFLCLPLTSEGQTKKQKGNLDNVLTKKEKKEGWRLLFDGKTADAWMNAKTGTFPTKGWVIKDGNLNVVAKGSGGDIVTKDKFKNFELIVDFKYAPGANSGIKYFIDTERDNGKYAGVGCEYQVLDDRLHPDAKAGKNGNRKLSSLYDLIPSKDVKDNGANQWNRAMITVKGNKVQHWLNGQLTVEYERGSAQWNQAVSESKFKGIPDFGMVQEGRILLQEHGNDVSYKNIKIRVLE